MKKWTVLLEYPEILFRGNYGDESNLYVGFVEADNPYEAVDKVREELVRANSWEALCTPAEFRPIGVFEGVHPLVLDATHFECDERGKWAPVKGDDAVEPLKAREAGKADRFGERYGTWRSLGRSE